MDKLREALKAQQDAEGVSVWQMGDLLGVNPGGFHRFMTGRQALGTQLAQRIVARYPDLRDLVTVALLGEQFPESADVA